MTITATELKENLGHYFDVVQNEDVFVSKNGKVIAQIINPNKDKMKILDSLIGIMPKDIDINKYKNERILS